MILRLCSATSETEQKQILDSFGMTAEQFRELFGPIAGFAGPDVE
ncbi:hypothetical protein [Streptomyces sp. NPDC127038]